MKKLLIIFFLSFAWQTQAAVFYVDFVNGLDTNAGTGTSTAFQSINAFANVARSAGDIAFVRRGQASTTNVTAVTFTSDGTLNNPITITADYDNDWGDFATSGVTWTPTFGSTFLASSASSTDFATPNKWIYLEGDCYEASYNRTASTTNPCEFAYEVASTSADGLSLYLPYKGNQSGSGKNMRVMPSAPQVGTATEAAQIFTSSTDDYWYLKGFDIRSTNSSCTISATSNRWTAFYDMILQGNGAGDCGIGGSQIFQEIKKVRLFNFVSGFNDPDGIIVIDFYLNCNNTASSYLLVTGINFSIKNGEIVNCTGLHNTAGNAQILFYAKNIKYTNVYAGVTGAAVSSYFFEDNFGTVGLNSQVSNQISANNRSTTTISTTTVTRSGGGPTTQYIMPPSGTGNTGISTKQFPVTYIKLFEYPIYTTATQRTYSMYFRSASSSAFVNDPFTSTQEGSSTPELYIECEYYNDSSDADRQLKRSNTASAVDFNTDTNWYAISVQCTPTQAGIIYIRGFYAKPKENPTNQFYMDTTPVITTP